jgi:hypothetical protein
MRCWFTGEANRLRPGFHSHCDLGLCPTCMAWVSKGWGQVEVLGNFGWIANTQTWRLSQMKSALCSAATWSVFLEAIPKNRHKAKKDILFIFSGYRGLLNCNKCQMLLHNTVFWSRIFIIRLPSSLLRNVQNMEFHSCCGLPHLYCMSFKGMNPGRSPGQFWLNSYHTNIATIKVRKSVL